MYTIPPALSNVEDNGDPTGVVVVPLRRTQEKGSPPSGNEPLTSCFLSPAPRLLFLLPLVGLDDRLRQVRGYLLVVIELH